MRRIALIKTDYVTVFFTSTNLFANVFQASLLHPSILNRYEDSAIVLQKEGRHKVRVVKEIAILYILMFYKNKNYDRH